jgi:predicted ArsR family transcriptional regulator
VTTLKQRVLAALGDGPGTPRDLAEEIGHPESKMLRFCCWMKREGYIKVRGTVPQERQGRPTPIYALLEDV